MKRIKRISFMVIVLAAFSMAAMEVQQPKNLFLPEGLELKDGKIVQKGNGSPIKLNKDTLKFAWDLDDTLAEPSWAEAMKLMASYQGIKFTLSYALSYLIKNQIGQAFESLKSSNREISAESLAEKLSEVDPRIAELIMELGNIINPKEGMLELVEVLKKMGYDQIIATNKEWPLFQRAVKKDTMQKLFELLPKAFIVAHDGHETDLVKSSRLKKPHDRYYQEFEKEFNPEEKWILFIDDSGKNITGRPDEEGQNGAIHNPHWISLKFESTQQLKDDLMSLGILEQ